MKKPFLKVLSASLLSVSLAVPIVAHAATIANGDLYYHGWQDENNVYSEIGNNSKYMVRASVKVGGNTYTSGYKEAYAKKSAARVWYADESSYYSYYKK